MSSGMLNELTEGQEALSSGMLNELTEAQEAFLALLRSGEIPQTTGTLKDDAGMCCLGVACEAHRRVTGRGKWRGSVYIPRAVEGGYAGSAAGALTAPDVRSWLGLGANEDAPALLDPGGRKSRELVATELNDYYGFSFKQLAFLFEYRWRTGNIFQGEMPSKKEENNGS